MKGKTVLKKKELNYQEDAATNEDNSESKIIKGKTKLGKIKPKPVQKKERVVPEKNISQQLLEQIIITYYTSAWQNKIVSMKSRVVGRTNEKAKDLRSIKRTVDNIINYHKYVYLMKLFDNMSNLPEPASFNHDPDYGKIFLVKGQEKGPEEPDKEEKEEEIKIIKEKSKIERKKKEEEPKKEEEEVKIIKEKSKIERKKKDEEQKKEIKREEAIIENKRGRKEVRPPLEEKEEFKELDKYLYRSGGKLIDRVEIEKDINKLIDEYPDKDIDVDRILHSKRLQYKLKHPRYSPLANKENLDSFIRYLYTYKAGKSGKIADNIIVIKNKTYAYY
jgi:hypothetical protein